MPGKVLLEVVKGPLAGKVYEYEEHDTFIFGRSRYNCHAQLADDPLVSRHHFILEVNPPQLCIRDLGSRNGTYINGVKHGGRHKNEEPEDAKGRVYPVVELRDGDMVRVGKTEMLVKVQWPRPDSSGAIPLPRNFHQQIAQGQAAHGQQPAPAMAEAAVPGAPGYSSAAGQAAGSPYGQGGDGWSQPEGPSGGNRLIDVPGYTVDQLLGQGDTGAVYLGRRLSDNQPVAVKFLHPRVATSRKAKERFLREVQWYMKLDHPHIVPMYDCGEENEIFYVVQEYCEMGDIGQAVQRNRIPRDLGTLGILMLQALGGVAFAHHRRLVHRDIKPQNILLGAQDKKGWMVKLGDFGLDKAFQAAGLSGMTATAHNSQSHYFTPREHITNFTKIHPGSDIWSLAATFYYLLTGAYPRDFPPHVDPVEVILSGDIVPLHERRADIPESVTTVFDCALANDVADRWESAQTMYQALWFALRDADLI